ncbi:Uncharacterized protein APZ42_021963 [Daphnia magna]|uniref:Uncharacterized protein n=1 Tax=Daphnia magna TaxID=35525 RepID=A0A164W783_9CRUS|nr:Uncharacterized protein APZ42_021963 [Daphnia magna]
METVCHFDKLGTCKPTFFWIGLGPQSKSRLASKTTFGLDFLCSDFGLEPNPDWTPNPNPDWTPNPNPDWTPNPNPDWTPNPNPD